MVISQLRPQLVYVQSNSKGVVSSRGTCIHSEIVNGRLQCGMDGRVCTK